MEKHFQFHTELMALPYNFPPLHLDKWAATENCADRETAMCSQCQLRDKAMGLQKVSPSLTDGWCHKQKAQLLLA